MHVYLPEKCRSPFLHGVFLFSKVGVLVVILRWLFSLLLTQVISWDLDLLEGLDIIILLRLPPFISRVVNFARHFS